MSLAFEQAKINLGSTGLNPSVGSIIVKNESVISSGHTMINGRPHAEKVSLNRNVNYNNSSMYVTLEPCSHYGKTSPCTNQIVKKKIKKVFFSIFDIDKKSSKKAIKILKNKYIYANCGLKKKYGKYFYESYFSSRNKKLPFICSKIAVSKDYFTISKKSRWITNSHSRKRVHFLRSQYNCIVSTSSSINKDNSLLNCRIEGLEKKSPDVVIFDRNLKLKKNLKILLNSKFRKIFLITSTTNNIKEKYLKKKNIKIIKIKNMKTCEDYKKIFISLNKKGYSRIFVESGLTFLNFLIKGKFLNYLYLFKSLNNLKMNGLNHSKSYYIKKLKLNNKIQVNLFGDLLYKVKLK